MSLNKETKETKLNLDNHPSQVVTQPSGHSTKMSIHPKWSLN